MNIIDECMLEAVPDYLLDYDPFAPPKSGDDMTVFGCVAHHLAELEDQKTLRALAMASKEMGELVARHIKSPKELIADISDIVISKTPGCTEGNPMDGRLYILGKTHFMRFWFHNKMCDLSISKIRDVSLVKVSAKFTLKTLKNLERLKHVRIEGTIRRDILRIGLRGNKVKVIWRARGERGLERRREIMSL